MGEKSGFSWLRFWLGILTNGSEHAVAGYENVGGVGLGFRLGMLTNVSGNMVAGGQSEDVGGVGSGSRLGFVTGSEVAGTGGGSEASVCPREPLRTLSAATIRVVPRGRVGIGVGVGVGVGLRRRSQRLVFANLYLLNPRLTFQPNSFTWIMFLN